MMRYSRYVLFCGTCALTLLAGCDAVGEGVAPTGLTLVPSFSSTGLTARQAEQAREAFEEGAPFRMTECLPADMQLVLEFDNGSRENATRRSENVRFFSSDESVLEVSNRDIPFTGEPAENPRRFFPRGALIPRGPGTATVTARFSNFEASMEVEVQPLGEITPFVDFPEVLAPNASAEVRADAKVNGQTLSITNTAAVRLIDVNTGQESEAARVEPTQSGVAIRGLEPATAQRVELDFELCDRSFQREFRVADIAELQVSRPNDDSQPLVIGLSELLRATAVFDDGSTLDLSNQARFTVPEDFQNLFLFPEPLAGGNNLLLGTSGGIDDGGDDGEAGDGAADGDDTVGEATGTGGTGMVTASFDQNPDDDAELEEGETDPTQVDADPLELTVRPGRVDAVRWLVEADGDGERVLELPQDCSFKPGVEADLRIALEDGSKAEVTRRIDREVNYRVGDEPIDSEDGVGNDDAEDANPVVEVVDRNALSLERRAGTITAVGEVGDQERVRAVLIQPTTTPGFEDVDNGEEETFAIEDELIVRVVERMDCASLEDAADVQ